MRYSGCGSQQLSVLQLRLSRQHLHSFIKKKIRFTGGYRGGPAYYMHHYVERRTGKTKKHVCIAVLFCNLRAYLLGRDQSGDQ